MKLGLGLGADPSAESGFNDANIAFCKQLGITHIIYSGAQQRLPAAPIAAPARSDSLPACLLLQMLTVFLTSLLEAPPSSPISRASGATRICSPRARRSRRPASRWRQ